MKRLISNIALVVLFSIMITIPLTAQSKDVKVDKTTKIYVQYNLAKDNLFDKNNIDVYVKNNTITLEGTVSTLAEKRRAEEDAKDVSDSYKILNNLNIASTDLSPAKIVKTVMHNIYSNTFYGVFDYVSAQYKDGVLSLNGYVHVPWFKKTFEHEAEKVAGITKINDNIKNTFGPGRLGIRAASLIYNDPMFAGYAFSSNPPIHIIVENGSVFLFGKVDSDVESSWAANAVRFRTDAFNVNNNIVVIKS